MLVCGTSFLSCTDHYIFFLSIRCLVCFIGYLGVLTNNILSSGSLACCLAVAVKLDLLAEKYGGLAHCNWERKDLQEPG